MNSIFATYCSYQTLLLFNTEIEKAKPKEKLCCLYMVMDLCLILMLCPMVVNVGICSTNTPLPKIVLLCHYQILARFVWIVIGYSTKILTPKRAYSVKNQRQVSQIGNDFKSVLPQWMATKDDALPYC